MSDSSPLQKLLREIAGNGKKAAILGVLLAVGLSIWIPQLGRLLRGPGEYAVSPIAHPTPSPPAVSAATTPLPSPPENFSWKQLADGIDREDFLRPFVPRTGIRSPFVDPKPEPEVVVAPVIDPQPPVVERPPPKPVQRELLPAPAQFVLKSTLQGKTTRGAVINGRYYTEGETIESEESSFVVSRVEARRVILKSDDLLYELLIPSVLPRNNSSIPKSTPSIPDNSL
jgi:hypothetical protein